jgi:hypothetical protein
MYNMNKRIDNYAATIRDLLISHGRLIDVGIYMNQQISELRNEVINLKSQIATPDV